MVNVIITIVIRKFVKSIPYNSLTIDKLYCD